MTTVAEPRTDPAALAPTAPTRPRPTPTRRRPTPDRPRPTPTRKRPTKSIAPTGAQALAPEQKPDRSEPRTSAALTPHVVGEAPVPAPSRPGAFRPDIQGLRAVAVVLVIAYHANVPGFTGGYVGVDVFFVISGFLITGHLLRELDRTDHVSILSFYGRRFRRLLPTASCVVLFTLVAARLWLPFSQVKTLVGDAFFASFYGINYHLAAQGVNYQQSSAAPSPLQHFWSLAVEEQFYVIWPILLVLCAVIGRRRFRVPLFAVVTTAVLAASLYFSVNVTRSDAPLAYFALHTRAWELAAGALIALLAPYLRHIPRLLASVVSWPALGVIIWAAAHYSNSTPFPGTAAIAPVAAAAVLVAVGGRQTRTGTVALLGRRPFQGVGKISYSLYLWHWPMLVILPYAAGHPFSWERNLEIVALAVWVSFVGFWLVENPGLRSKARSWVWVGRGAALSGSMAVGAVVIGLTLPSLVGTGAAVTAIRLDSASTATVQHAIATGLVLTKAPDNLSPTPAQAPDDVPVSSKGAGCLDDFLDAAVTPCAYGDLSATRTVVLFGDSHAQQWLGTLIPTAVANHWRIITLNKAACPVADLTVFAPALKRTYTECNTWRTAAVAEIAHLHPALLIASQADLVVNASVPSATYAEATLTTLRSTGAKDIEFLADTPDTASDPATCLQDNLSDIQPCAFSATSAYENPSRQQEIKHVLTTAGIGYSPTLQWFCNGFCPVVIGNIAVYRDAGHMTNTYASWLAPLLAPLLPPLTASTPASHH